MPAAEAHPMLAITHPSDTETVVRRAFPAPAEDLFTLWTTPALVRRWWSSTGEMSVCDVDLRVGGTWRWAHVNPEHDLEVAYSGVYTAVDRPRVLAFTELFEMVPGSEYANQITFEEIDGVTTVVSHMTYTTKDWRDGHRAAGFEEGLTQAHARMDQLLEDRATW